MGSGQILGSHSQPQCTGLEGRHPEAQRLERQAVCSGHSIFHFKRLFT